MNIIDSRMRGPLRGIRLPLLLLCAIALYGIVAAHPSGVPRYPRLVWRTTPPAASYRLQVSGTDRFFSTVVDSTIADTTLLLTPLTANTSYYWHVSASNDSGVSSYSAPASFMTGDQIVSVNELERIPAVCALSQNYPNPFNPSTTIRYGLAGRTHVTVTIFNTLGQRMATLVDEYQEAGYHDVRFDGSTLASGVYFYRVRAGDFVQSRRLVTPE